MPKVPQLVPVAKDRKQAIRKMMAGRKAAKPPALPLTTASTNSFAPRESVMAFRLQAKVRIRIAGTMALKPSGMLSVICLKVRTRRTR